MCIRDRYHLDVPALAALAGNVDLNYAGFNPKVGDVARGHEFVRDMQAFVQGDRVPSFTYVWIPTQDSTIGVKDADAALGEIVDFISHTCLLYTSNAHPRFSSSVKPAVKPGPNELSSARFQGVVDASVRSSTNITVAADMLP